MERIVEKHVPSTCERTVVKEVVDNSEIERLRDQIKALERARDRERAAPPPPPQVVERVVTKEVPVEKIVEKLVVKEVPVDRIVTVTKEVSCSAPFNFRPNSPLSLHSLALQFCAPVFSFLGPNLSGLQLKLYPHPPA